MKIAHLFIYASALALSSNPLCAEMANCTACNSDLSKEDNLSVSRQQTGSSLSILDGRSLHFDDIEMGQERRLFKVPASSSSSNVIAPKIS